MGLENFMYQGDLRSGSAPRSSQFKAQSGTAIVIMRVPYHRNLLTPSVDKKTKLKEYKYNTIDTELSMMYGRHQPTFEMNNLIDLIASNI